MNKKYIIVLLTLFIFQNCLSQNKTIQETGDVLQIVLPATALASTIITKDFKGTWQFTKAFALNKLVTFGLKRAINKDRPDMTDQNAFPSGHTSTAFQGASFIQQRYGWKYGIPAYVLAGFTGYSRINAERHDLLDVFAGALVGIGSTYLFTTPYQRDHMELSFSSGDGAYMIGFRFKF
ncbi:phosphatase PAP2 family protein [Leptobacterium flavescens]|uniref:Phosphatase PAP2 family protein n=1 Tax=Leptobacterium flavescens TaxID=472055 RepID=A0A6P0UP75_9FLAO|nr:phosphatase PAP2 family protein [Leptobacterium flavescens]NER13639.1 phosphatase PAP2 family protein [Leptobacterium flavescens]